MVIPNKLPNDMAKLRVAHSIIVWLPLTATWVYNQLRFASSLSHIVLALETQNLEKYPWTPIYAPGRFNRFIYRVGRKLELKVYPSAYHVAINQHHSRILHSHFGDQGWRDLPLARAHGLRHVVTFYGYDVNMLPATDEKWRRRYLELFARADLFLCEGTYMANSLISLGCPAEKVRVHHLGVDLEKIPFKPRKIQENKPIRILVAGTFREKKGIPYAINAVGELRKKHFDVHLTIIGDSTGQKLEEEEKKKIFRAIDKYDLRSKVHLLGFQPQEMLMEQAYNHHIFLSPSVTASNGDTEGGAPVSIIEMVASGMPVISSRHCDIPEAIPENICGLLADERDVDGLVRQLEWLVEHTDQWEALTARGRKHIEENYNARLQGKWLEKIYESLG
jgi:colanic acid/amylovoran/stewartan biosynthesis glycosyltransferase WcaL/AmsK/CpsK